MLTRVAAFAASSVLELDGCFVEDDIRACATMMIVLIYLEMMGAVLNSVNYQRGAGRQRSFNGDE